METELLEQHLIPYLNHDLKFLDTQTNSINTLTIRLGRVGECPINIAIDHLDIIKPLLHPLSMLTKEIQHKGETLIMSEYLLEKYAHHIDEEFINQILEDDRWINHLPHFIYQDLVSKMFDVNDLIPRGLALDKSTLKK